MINFIIQHDFLICLLAPFILGLVLLRDWDSAVAFGMIGTFILSIGAILNSLTVNWNDAKIYKIISASEIQQIELPDHTIQIWRDKEHISTLTTLTDYLRRDQIDHIEYRRLEIFGPDFDEYRLIFKEDLTKTPN